MKKKLFGIVVLLIVFLSVFGVSTEKRLGFYWGEVETTRDVYCRMFPMLKINISTYSRQIHLKYSKDGLEPEWIVSLGYRDKGGKRMDIDDALRIIESDVFQNRLDTDADFAKRFKDAITPVVRDTSKLMDVLKG